MRSTSVNAVEVTFSTSGALGEAETAGVVMNIVPRTGGNAVRGSGFASGTGARLQGGQSHAGPQSAGIGGGDSARKGVRHLGGRRRSDLEGSRLVLRQRAHGRSHERLRQRLLQPERRQFHAVAVCTGLQPARVLGSDIRERKRARHLASDFAQQGRHLLPTSRSCAEPVREPPPAFRSLRERRPRPSASWAGRSRCSQATWFSPLTSRLLVEAGFGSIFFGVGNFERTPNPTRDLIRVVEQCASGCAANGNIPGLAYRSQDFSSAYTGSYLWKGSVSYVTGTHSVKVGYQHTLMTDDRTWMTNNQNLTYRVSNGVPNQLTESISPWTIDARAAWDAVFAQEQWTLRRLTLQGAVRFDRAHSWFPAQQEGPSRFLPVPIIVPETRGVDSYKDITPRMGAAYDLFGTGRTALKVNLGKYLEGVGTTGNYANTNPTMRMPQTTPVFGTAGVTRAWTDANGNFAA